MENYVLLMGVLMNKPVLQKKNKHFTTLEILLVENGQPQKYNIIAFEEVAQNICQTLTSKQMIKIEGKLNRNNRISNVGTYHSNISIICNNFEFMFNVDDNLNPITVKQKPKRDSRGRFIKTT